MKPEHSSRKRGRLRALLVAAVAAAGLAVPSTASADLLQSFTAEVRDENGDPYTQAGGHPFEAFTDIDFFQHLDSNNQPVPDESVRNVVVDLPPGLVGNPQAVPKCTREEINSLEGCPDSTAVGWTALKINGTEAVFPVYNIEPPPHLPAQFAFVPLIPRVFVSATVRPDGGLRVTIPNISQALPLVGTSLTFWGVPGDPAHDTMRGECAESFDPNDECPFEGTVKPFLTNPTACLGPQTTVLRADSWQNPGDFEVLTSTTPVGADGCEDVPFEPSLNASSGVSSADSPSGFSVEIEVPQEENPDGIVQAHLRDASVTLPEGMTINPAAADGLAGCTQAQIGLGNDNPPACPPSSKVGTVRIDSPLLPEPLRGGIFVAEPNNNPFSNLFAIYLVAEGPGTMIKLAGNIVRDPQTGRITTVIEDAPPLPFSRFAINFFGGSRAVLATPTTCGPKTVSAELTPWSGNAPTTVTASFSITSGPNGGPCVSSDAQRSLNPGLTAGLTNPVAGASSPFTLRVSRNDGDQELSTIDATLPPGVSAVIRGVPQCGDAQAATGACPPESRIGSVSAKVGAGSNPFTVTGGSAYLAGPYKGAPLSLVFAVPARAGIFDLGMVVVRAAVFVDPTDAHLRVVSDPIPQVLEGVPLRMRQIAIEIDRPGFMTSPTSCAPQQVTAQVTGSDGATGSASQRFQVAGCSSLPFAAKLTTKITGGKKATKRSRNPGLRTKLVTREGDANVRRVALTLPRQIFLDQDSLETICTRDQYAAEQCPEGSIYGTARAETPLLDGPLTGNVYLRASDNELPDLVADLNGQVEIDLVGRIDQRKGAIRTTFETVPDVPVSDFVLKLQGGDGGLLVNSRSLCGKRKLRSTVKMKGQNGKSSNSRPKLKASCGKRKKR